MKVTAKNYMVIGALLYSFSNILFAVNSDPLISLKLEDGHLNYIVNSSQTAPTLVVEYQICSYDYTNERIKAWMCTKPLNDVAVVQQNKVFNVFVPNNRIDQNGKVEVEYAVQIFTVQNSTKEELRKGFSAICRTGKDRNALLLTDNLSNSNGDKIKCDSASQ